MTEYEVRVAHALGAAGMRVGYTSYRALSRETEFGVELRCGCRQVVRVDDSAMAALPPERVASRIYDEARCGDHPNDLDFQEPGRWFSLGSDTGRPIPTFRQRTLVEPAHRMSVSPRVGRSAGSS